MFIIEEDFQRVLNSTDLTVMLTESELNSTEILGDSVDFAVSFVRSKIQHRYDYEQIFIDVNTFSLSTTYAENDQVIYQETAHSATTAYTTGDRVSYNQYIYEANKDITGAFDTDDWDLVTTNNSMYYATTASTGNYPDDTDYFTKGDLRNPLIRDYSVIIALQRLFIRVQPRNFPTWIIDEHERVIAHLDRISSGKDTLLLPLYLDDDGDEDNDKGQNVLYGSETQKTWNY